MDKPFSSRRTLANSTIRIATLADIPIKMTTPICTYKSNGKQLHGVKRDEDVDPDDFIVWGFERLLHHRIPLYEQVAANHGYVVEMKEIPRIRDDKDFLDLLARAITS